MYGASIQQNIRFAMDCRILLSILLLNGEFNIFIVSCYFKDNFICLMNVLILFLVISPGCTPKPDNSYKKAILTNLTPFQDFANMSRIYLVRYTSAHETFHD